MESCFCIEDIFKIETESESEVYDLTVLDNHNYFLDVNGKKILSHNSGKTYIILYAIILRALMHVSDHLICRFRFSHVKQSICFQTMPKILKTLGLSEMTELNKSDWYYSFPNGSRIWVGGLDDKERTEKILGNEYATIFPNEASQISWDSIEILLTRLNPPKELNPKMFIDYNPPSMKHWGFKIFHERKFPDGKDVPDNDYGVIRMNPTDNQDNLSPGYIDTLENLSFNKRKRFLLGEYTEDIGSLWKRTFFKYQSEIKDCQRIVIGVDPSGSKDGDEVGIIIAGIIDNLFYVLDDYSLHGSPNEWSLEVKSAYEKWKADLIVAEKNYGGEMVESTIKNSAPQANVKLINSSRGKILRAEPISALYEQGRVIHRIPFLLLEDECCSFTPESDFSPNRLDALVFALTELSSEGISMLDVI